MQALKAEATSICTPQTTLSIILLNCTQNLQLFPDIVPSLNKSDIQAGGNGLSCQINFGIRALKRAGAPKSMLD